MSPTPPTLQVQAALAPPSGPAPLTFRQRLHADWLGNVRGDLLAGLVVALALIPEAIAFSIVAGVDPKIGLYASFSIAVVTAIVGGRPGMISAATAATAVLMVTLVKEHGLEYLLAASVLAGVLQVLAGLLRLGSVMRFVSRSVVTGFVNALAILIFLAQLPELVGVPALTYPLVAAGLAIIYLFPFATRAIPSPLVCILALTAVTVGFGLDVRTVGDMGALPDTLPVFLLPDIPLTWETLTIILPYAAAVAVVGLLESLMTATIVDEMTDSTSDKNRECVGQGVANVTTGFLGGMAGCAMIGQSVINIRSGGRGRLSTLFAGVALLVLCIALGDQVSLIPMPALVAIMIMVSISTFKWRSLVELTTNPRSSSVVMVATVAVVVGTHNLAIGVLVGVLLSGLFFGWKVAQLYGASSTLTEDTDAAGAVVGMTRVYRIQGEIFYASAERFSASFDFKERVDRVVIDVTHAHIWDISGVGAIDAVVLKFRRAGVPVEVIGLNEASATLVDRIATYGDPNATAAPPGH